MNRNPDRERPRPSPADGPTLADRAGSFLPTSAFDYALPPELIASHPAARRDESRLLVIDRASGAISHHIFREFPDFVPSGDALVLNETRVFPARLVGQRAGGGEAEVLLLRPADSSADVDSATAGHRDSGNCGAGTSSAALPSRRLAVPPSGGSGPPWSAPAPS